MVGDLLLYFEMIVWFLVALGFGLYFGWLIWGWRQDELATSTADDAYNRSRFVSDIPDDHFVDADDETTADLNALRDAHEIEIRDLRAAHEKELQAARLLADQSAEDRHALQKASENAASLEAKVSELERALADCRAKRAALEADVERAKSQTAEPINAANVNAATPQTAVNAAVAATPDASKPQMFDAPPATGKDDLKRISGVGPKLEGVLNNLGVYTFQQIAAWTEKEIAWVDEKLKFRGRIQRDRWVEQARQLAEGGETTFSKRVDRGEVYN